MLRVILLSLILFLPGCATTRYEPLAESRGDLVTQLQEDTYRVEYRVNLFTSQEVLDDFLRRRCAEVTLQQGYDQFLMTDKLMVLSYNRSTSVTLRMFKGPTPAGALVLYDAKDVLGLLNSVNP